MAQGQVKAKPLKPTGRKSSHQTGGITKKGSRSINARDTKLQKQAKMNKKLTSGMTAQTERMLGEKAGHLEMIGSKKGSNKEKEGLKKAGKKK